MTEDFLHYVWQYRLFDSRNLLTTKGEEVEVLNPGQHNLNAGPDFLESRVKIDGTEWAGNVEIHLRTSDWARHRHQEDPAYNNVILHLVFQSDSEAKTADGRLLPELELAGKLPDSIFDTYQSFLRSRQWVPCASQVRQTDDFVIHHWLDRLLANRLERKSLLILDVLKQTSNDWAETFYILLARNFGFKVNSQPFEMLARSLPYRHLGRNIDNLFILEALLFGQAGMLEKDFEDLYPQRLKKEYQYLKGKYSLDQVVSGSWKFMRLRPSNFPTLRLAQFARLIQTSDGLFRRVIECESLEELQKLFNVEASEYWDTHYNFDKATSKKAKRLGAESVKVILINTVIPFLFTYGRERMESQLEDRAFRFLEGIPRENNSVIKKWETLGLPADNAYQTQALLELKSEYCNQKKCLNCSIGNHILRSRI